MTMITGAALKAAPQAPTARKRVELFGVQVDALTIDQTVERSLNAVRGRTPVQHVVLNAAKVVAMKDDPALRKVIAGCDIVNADGSSVVWASRLLGRPLPERVAGIDLFDALLARAAAEGLTVYFLGARAEVLKRMMAHLRDRYPALRVAGYHDGYWTDDAEVISDLREVKPDMLFLAIPSPRKEFWLASNLAELDVPFVMGVGGSFDVLAGDVARAPLWVQRIGCEWLYRVAQEPRRMWRRYLFGNTRFVWLVLKEYLGGKPTQQSRS